MKLRQNISQKQILSLRQVLSPKLIQMLKTFNLSYSTLADKIETEANDNVFLEIAQFDRLKDQYITKRKSNDFMGKDWTEYLAESRQGESLHTYLESQIDLEHLGEKDKKIALDIIEHIDEKGYITNFAEVQETLSQKYQMQARKIKDILTVIQSLDPDGVGARTLKECLLIQIDHHDFESEQLKDTLYTLVREHLESLNPDNYEKIAQKMDIAIDGVEALHDFIKQNLSPYPGSAFSSPQAINQHIVPSFEVTLDEQNTLHIKNLEQTDGVQITLSTQHQTLLNDPNLDKESKAFLEEKLKKAKTLIENIQKRHENLEKLMTYIAQKQKLFFENGPDHLVPLLQKDIAEHLSVSPSTVSRIVSSKYVLSPHGLYALKQLCPRNHFGKTAERLKKIIFKIALNNPSFSDEKIKTALEEMGMKIARRTVNKYRLLAQKTN